jgi:hypothetical protein
MFQAVSFMLRKISCFKAISSVWGPPESQQFWNVKKSTILTDSVIPHLYRINCTFFKVGPFSKEILQQL